MRIDASHQPLLDQRLVIRGFEVEKFLLVDTEHAFEFQRLLAAFVHLHDKRREQVQARKDGAHLRREIEVGFVFGEQFFALSPLRCWHTGLVK